MELSQLRRLQDQGLPFRVSLEAVNKAVGLVALGLPIALLLVGKILNSCAEIDSISHYYFTRLGGDILVGSLSLIGVLLAFFYQMPRPVDGYLGHTRTDIWLAKLAGLCAFGIAFVPTTGSGCEEYAGSVARLFLTGVEGSAVQFPPVGAAQPPAPSYDFWATLGVDTGMLRATHNASALVMFSVLAYFALVVFRRPQSAAALEDNQTAEATKARRNRIYLLSGWAIVAAILALVLKTLLLKAGSDGLALWNAWNLTFWFESAALMAFGISWATKGRIFSALRDPGEDDPRQTDQGRAA